MKKIPLHIQIVLALILGAGFGAIFSVNYHSARLTYLDNKSQKIIAEIEDWDSIYIKANNEIVEKISSDEQIKLVQFFKKHKKENFDIEVYGDQTIKNYSKVIAAEKVPTIATYIKPIGTLFLRLLSFIAIPLVISSLIVGAASLGDVKRLGRIGLRTIGMFLVTTALAIIIGVSIANILQPGNRIEENTRDKLVNNYSSDAPIMDADEIKVDIVDFFINIVPKNPIEAMSSGNMLQIVFFAVLFGITLNFIELDKSKMVIQFFDAVSDVMIKLVNGIMLIAPIGVFALMAATVADFGFEILSTLLWYSFAVVLGLFLHTVVVYGGIVKFIGKMKVGTFFKGIRNAQAIGFSSSSSAATLPVTFECVEEKLGIKKDIAGFVLPLGATINMDGTALYQGVATIFIAQVYNVDLTFADQITVVLTAVLASIGTAPVPGVGLIMLIMILNSVNVPVEGIALILGVDRILDMLRTITNVSGDCAVSVAINQLEIKKT